MTTHLEGAKSYGKLPGHGIEQGKILSFLWEQGNIPQRKLLSTVK
jgi:hypothetical protein